MNEAIECKKRERRKRGREAERRMEERQREGRRGEETYERIEQDPIYIYKLYIARHLADSKHCQTKYILSLSSLVWL